MDEVRKQLIKPFNGEYKERFFNGNLYVHCFFKNNKLYGEYKDWYNDGTLALHCYYNKYGMRHGECICWRVDGTICCCRLYEHGTCLFSLR